LRFGYRTEGRGFLLTNAVKQPDWKDRKHEVFYYLNLVSEIEKSLLGSDTVSNSAPKVLINVSADRLDKAEADLSNAGFLAGKPKIGLGVGSQNSEAKRWPADRFGKLNDCFQKNLNANVVLIGSESEVAAANEVAAASTRKPIDLTGKTNLDEAVALLASLDLFVSNDMGLAHIASAVGTKTLTIFGPTNPLTTNPFNGEILVREDVDCAPCMLRACPIDHRCMTRIESEDVYARASTLLAKSSL
jgi:heptosyltransferase-2